MNFEESVKYVETATRKSRDKVDLSVITELLMRLDNPQDSFKSIHVAGTNGKGSICAYVESALREQGYKTGLFTSPYISVFNERIQISGANVEVNTFAETATIVRTHAEDMQKDGYPPASFFELLTAIAFAIFSQKNVDIAIIETGIGGTYDSTNVISPVLSIISTIGYDHMNMLGNSIDAIAENKAGIIKENCPVVVSNQVYDEAYAVLLNTARQKKAPLFAVNKSTISIDAIGFDGAKFSINYGGIKAQVETSLVGYHQVYNAACAFLSLCVLTQYTDTKLSSDSILKGIRKTKWMCRMEIVSNDPMIILDGAHNENAVASLVKSIKTFLPMGKVNIIYGVMQKKNYLAMAKVLDEIAQQIYTVSFDDERGVDGAELAEELVEDNINAVNIGDLDTTLSTLRAQKNTPILVCGSLYLAGKTRNTLFTLKKH